METIEHVAGQQELFHECGFCQAFIVDGGIVEADQYFWRGEHTTRFCNHDCLGNFASDQED